MSRTTSVPAHTTTWKASLLIAGAACLAVCVVLLAFVWPAKTSTVQDLPIDVVGSGQNAAQVQAGLGESGAFDVGTVDTRDAAVQAIRERESYAAVVLPAGPGQDIEVLTSTAASPVVSQMMGEVGSTLQAQAAANVPPGMPAPGVTVTDVVPLSQDDPRGVGLGIAALPLAMGGMIGGVLISLLVTGSWRRLTACLVYGVLGGVALTAILDPWFGFLPGGFLINAAVIGLSLVATAATIVGLNALLGTAGIALGSILTLFIGNPLASANAPVEFLPGIWGAVGQHLVPGASVTLLRLVNYFPDASTATPWLVLAAWAAVGFVLMVTGHFRSQEVVHLGHPAHDDAAPREPAPVA